MTLPENKIVVQDVTEKIDNPREKMYNQRIKKKPFIFKGYKTELDRIKDTIRNNRYLYNLPEPEEKLKSNKTISQSTDKLILNPQINNMTYSQKYELSKSIPTTKRIVDDINLNPDLIDYLIKNDIIIQPQMRFKARTDLERVYEALSGNFYRDNEREILNRQLKSLDLFNYKKPEDFIKLTNLNNDIDKSIDEEEEKKSYKIKPNPLIEEEKKKEESDKKKIYKNPKFYYVPLNNERWRKRTDLNIEAYGMLKEYHQKTHFKATEEIAENKIKTKKFIKNDNDNIPLINKDKKSNRKKLVFDFDDDDKKKLNENNYIPYQKNYNPIIRNNKEHINSASMQLLTSMAFKSNNDFNLNQNKDKNKIMNVVHIKNKSNLVDENNVLIGNEIFFKANQFDLIANRVLNLCHVYKKKNKHNNGSLKKGNGKMMFTQGLTINEFEKKYDLTG